MNKIKGILGLVLSLFAVTYMTAQESKWYEIAVFDGKEIYIDTTSIKRNEVEVEVWVKELYTKDFQKEAYVAKIEKAMTQTKSERKSWDKKWSKKFANLSYTLSKRVYNCAESSFQTLEVVEYDVNEKRIVKISTKKKDAPWRLVEYDTIGDVLMFEVCDNY